MITAKQAYANHIRWKVYSETEKFVHSVLERVITDEGIYKNSIYKKEQTFKLEEILHKIFCSEEKTHHEYTITSWLIDYSTLPSELQGYTIRGLVKELEQVYEVDPQISFICKCFKALIYELQDIRGFKIYLDLEQHILTISWDLSSTENA